MEHISSIKIENFKKFDSLEIENIGQINLIVGDNNVGKTTLLESLLFSEDNLKWISHLHRLLCFRGIHIHPKNLSLKEPKFPEENFLTSILGTISKPLSIEYSIDGKEPRKIDIEYLSIDKLSEEDIKLRRDKYDIANVKDWVKFYKNNHPDELQWMYFDDKERNLKYNYWPFIAFNMGYASDLHDFIMQIDEKVSDLDFGEKQRVLGLLKIFIPDILDYELKTFGRDKLIGIATESNKSYRALTQYGDGVQKFFRYVIEIIYAQKMGESRIMIDEVDTGVHYLRMQDEWKAVIELAKQTGIQIFATTHSLDCIKSFIAAGNETKFTDSIRLIELKEAVVNGKKKIYVNTLVEDQIGAAIDAEVNIRGGQIHGKY